MSDKRSSSKQRESVFGRKATCKWERSAGKKRSHRTLEEKLRKYAVNAEAYEFVPAMMHLLERYVTDTKSARTDLDDRLARALDKVPGAKSLIKTAVERHREIPRELKRRVFSPQYLDMKVEQPLDSLAVAGIVDRATHLVGRNVSEAINVIGVAGKPTTKPCGCCDGRGGSTGGNTPPPPKPNRYELSYSKLYCVDESDPEWWGSDEPYVVFAVITEEMAETGTTAQGFHSPVYEDVDDGDTRPEKGEENLRLFGFTGPRDIASSVLITATCFEHDTGDVSETTDAIRKALTSVATTAASAGGVAGWIVAGVAVVGIGVSYLVDLIGADDQIGKSIALSLTEAQADSLTTAVNPYVFPPLHFDGGDDDGIYDVYIKLRRV